MILDHEIHRELAFLHQRELDRLAGRPRLEREPRTLPRLTGLRRRLTSITFRLYGIPAPARHQGTC